MASSSRTKTTEFTLAGIKFIDINDEIQKARDNISKRVKTGPQSVSMESLEDIPKKLTNKTFNLLEHHMGLLTVQDKIVGWMTNLSGNLPRLVKARESQSVDSGIEGPCLVAGGSNPITPLIRKQYKLLRQDHLPPNKRIPVVACDRAFSFLARLRVPEYTVVLENNRDPNYDFLFGDARRKYTKDSTLYASIITHPDIVAAWKGDIVFYRHEFPPEAINLTQFCDFFFEPLPRLWHGGNVGTTSFMVAAFLRGNPIGLVGMDFGIKTEFDDPKLGPQFVTDPVLLAYANAFASAIKVAQEGGTRVVNCTEGGILRTSWIERLTLEAFFKEVSAS